MRVDLTYKLDRLEGGSSRGRPGRAWIASIAALWAASALLGGLEVRGFFPLLLSAGLLAVLHTYVRPVALVLTLPFTLITLGLFTFVLNGLLLLLVGALVPGVTVAGFWAAVWAALWVSLFSWVAGWALRRLAAG
ncbi:phage holin family protein [Limnochorda pilosa]|uniref:Membrane protein n=1 Tax=Limnochorda pilosa TaxID=1555112 RepID=A0A0K2SI04_LIMPI|nr:phage holin family protein [Limnochorda pilosa]BAS26484.1 membrane protein [Limnochorda pilosa]